MYKIYRILYKKMIQFKNIKKSKMYSIFNIVYIIKNIYYNLNKKIINIYHKMIN